MKLRTISPNKSLLTYGYLVPEAIIAFSLMTLFLVSIMTLSFSMQELREEGIRQLEETEWAIGHLSSSTLLSIRPYGNYTEEKFLEPLTVLASDYGAGWGRDSCATRLSFDSSKLSAHQQGIDLGSGNLSTDLEVRNGFVYLSADSNISSSPDLYIIDATDPDSPVILSSLNTGPGLSALEVTGPYIYAANLGTTNQLQVIDIHNRSSPIILSRFKLLLPHPSSTPPLATAIFQSHGKIYLGTEKWAGNEFSVIDVSTPSAPQHLGGFEMDTQVNDIYVKDGIAFVAASNMGQLKALDVSNASAITEVESFSPSGWETQIGRTLSYFEGRLFLGRTTGGVNRINSHEIFAFSTTTSPAYFSETASHDIPGGVYGSLLRSPHIFLATRSPESELQVWNESLTQMLHQVSLGFLPRAMACDRDDLYFATGDERGIGIIKLNSQ